MTRRTQKTLLCSLSVLLLSGCCEAAYGPGKCIEMEKQHRAMQHLIPHSDTTLNPVVPPAMPQPPVETVIMQEMPQTHQLPTKDMPTKDMPVVDMTTASQPMSEKAVDEAPVISQHAQQELKEQMQAEQKMRELQTKMAQQARQTDTQIARVPNTVPQAISQPAAASAQTPLAKTPAVEVLDVTTQSPAEKWLKY